MKLNTKNVVMGLITPVALLGLLATNPASAREPYSKADLADMEKQLLEVVNHGRELWHGSMASMSTNGLACGNCHPDAAASNPDDIPQVPGGSGQGGSDAGHDQLVYPGTATRDMHLMSTVRTWLRWRPML